MSHTTGGGRNLNEIERQWFARVKEAQAHYRQAAEHQKLTIEVLNKAVIEPADGNYALAHANRAAKLALDDLVRCQETLVKLLLQGDIPPAD
jgi:hypothetical protein